MVRDFVQRRTASAGDSFASSQRREVIARATPEDQVSVTRREITPRKWTDWWKGHAEREQIIREFSWLH